jgi:putative intracellular protease/amidase
MKNNLWMALGAFVLFASCKNNNERNEIVAKDTAHAATMAEIFQKPKVDIKTVGILLYDGYSTLDAMGPYSVFNELMGTKVFFVGRHKGVIEDFRGMKVEIDSSIDDIKHLDILVIPGGFAQTYQATKDTALLHWIKNIDATSTYTTSVCTGAWILGATGLLKDKESTTHWWGKKILANEFGAKVENARYTHSGKYWTSAGISAGIDMSLALINEIRGERYTEIAMLDLEYDPQPPLKGGSEGNTDKALVEEMRKMYDAGMKTVLHPGTASKEIKVDNKKDPVCGMQTTADVRDTVHYKGNVYGFCSKLC